MPNILVVNDDGLSGDGLRPLIKSLSKISEVFVVVPKEQMSGTSQSITLVKKKKALKIGKNFYALKGASPADCVKYGLLIFKNKKFDLVVSGINNSPNMGQDIFYSGTVGGAKEGALNGIPSIAVSAAEFLCKNYSCSSQAAKDIALKILKNKKMPADLCLNINIPQKYKGIKIAPLGMNEYCESVENVIDKKGFFYYKSAGRYFSGGKNKKSDIYFVEKGYISITPLILNQTNFFQMKKQTILEMLK